MQAKLNPAFLLALRQAVVVPVLTVHSPRGGVQLAQALGAGGLQTIEITLRTPGALEALRAIRMEVPGVRVGAGTVLSPEQGREAILAGAQFIVSPGMTPRLIEAAERWPVPFLPGAVTASEAMALADLGYKVLKFFPAEACGGAAALKALAAPLADLQFCPTGGIGAKNVRDYLALPNVAAVGGSWVAPESALDEGDWGRVTALAREASALRR